MEKNKCLYIYTYILYMKINRNNNQNMLGKIKRKIWRQSQMNRIWEFRPTKLGGIIMVHHHAIMLTDPILDLGWRGILKITWGYVWLSNGFKLSIQCVLVKFACIIYKGIGATPNAKKLKEKLGKTNGGHSKHVTVTEKQSNLVIDRVWGTVDQNPCPPLNRPWGTRPITALPARCIL